MKTKQKDNYITLDWKTSPEKVLENINCLLTEYNIKIETKDEGNDSYYFRVVKK